MKKSNREQRGSFFTGFLISFCFMIIVLVVLKQVLIQNAEILGAVSVYPFFGTLLTGFISRFYKMKLFLLLITAILVEGILFFINYYEVIYIYK